MISLTSNPRISAPFLNSLVMWDMLIGLVPSYSMPGSPPLFKYLSFCSADIEWQKNLSWPCPCFFKYLSIDPPTSFVLSPSFKVRNRRIDLVLRTWGLWTESLCVLSVIPFIANQEYPFQSWSSVNSPWRIWETKKLVYSPPRHPITPVSYTHLTLPTRKLV